MTREATRRITRFGLVTVLYNAVDVLEGFFKSLAAQTHRDWFLEVIDNSPGEAPLNRARELAEAHGLTNVNFVRNPDNYGVAKGNNQGIHNCLKRGCDYVILLNNDIEFPDVDLLSAIARQIEHHGYAILVPKIYYFDSGKIWYGGGTINELSAVAVHHGDGEGDGPLYSQDKFTGYAPTCFMVLKAGVFGTVGMMDERYFVYYDDTDFALRCGRAGVRLRYLGNLSLYHKVSSSTGGTDSVFTTYYYNRNKLFFIRKNAKGWLYPASLLWYFASRPYRYLKYSAENRAALVRAVRDGLTMG